MHAAQKRFVWLTLFSWLCFAGLVKADVRIRKLIPKDVTHLEVYSGITIVAWQILRLTSYALDYCDALTKLMKKENFCRKFSTLNLIGFCFYLPVLRQGPSISYSSYVNMIEENVTKSSQNSDFLKRAKNLVKELIGAASTCFIAVLMMHFLYADAFIYAPNVSHKLITISLSA